MDQPVVSRTDASVRGVVKFWRADKGWGVISSDVFPPGRDAFAHFSVIEMEGFRSLADGQIVDFRFRPARQDSFEFVADWVRPVATDPANGESR